VQLISVHASGVNTYNAASARQLSNGTDVPPDLQGSPSPHDLSDD